MRPCIYHIFWHLIKRLIFCRIGHAGSTQSHPSFLNAYFIVRKEWCHVIKIRIYSLSYRVGWAKLVLHRLIRDLGQHVPRAQPIFLDPTSSQSLRGGKEEVPKVSPNFQNRLQCTTSYRALNREFSQRRIKPIVHPFLRNLQITLFLKVCKCDLVERNLFAGRVTILKHVWS